MYKLLIISRKLFAVQILKFIFLQTICKQIHRFLIYTRLLCPPFSPCISMSRESTISLKSLETRDTSFGDNFKS